MLGKSYKVQILGKKTGKIPHEQAGGRLAGKILKLIKILS